MDPSQQAQRQAEARRRQLSQRRRVGELRVRVATIAVTGFVALWGVVFAQMATGHDPVLGSATTTSAVVGREGLGAESATRTATEAVETTDPEEFEEESVEVEAPEVEFVEPEPEPEPEPELPPVTTSQS